MSRKVFITDGSEISFYAAVFRAWRQEAYITASKNFQPLITDEIVAVDAAEKTAEEEAGRVQSALFRIDPPAPKEIRRILSSGNLQKEQIAYLYLREIIGRQAPAREKTYLACVRNATDVLHKIGKEIEHLKGFLRFRETAHGVYYAACAPDNDVIPSLAPHFIRRLACPFIIHDISRGYALCFNGEKTICIEAKEAEIPLSASEEEFAALWASYFKNVAIRARKNQKQQDNLMPRRYRKFMPET